MGDNKKQLAYDAEWKKKNTVLIGMRLQKSTDADIISAIENSKSKQGELKRLIRLGLAYETVLNQRMDFSEARK